MVLFRQGDWSIEEINWSLSSLSQGKLYLSTVLKHRCFSPPDMATIAPRVSTHCWKCTAKIPEGLIALWKFQNWEKL